MTDCHYKNEEVGERSVLAWESSHRAELLSRPPGSVLVALNYKVPVLLFLCV